MTLREKAIEAGTLELMRHLMVVDGVDDALLAVYITEPEADLARAAMAKGLDAILSVIMEPDEAMIKAGKSVTAVEASTGRDMYLDTVSVVEAYKSMIRKLMGDRG